MEDYIYTGGGETNIFHSTSELDDSILTNSTSTFALIAGGEITIDSFEFKETSDGNFIEVVKRQKPSDNITYTVSWDVVQKDKVWKEIYGVTGTQELKLINTINALVTPAHHVSESIEFEE